MEQEPAVSYRPPLGELEAAIMDVVWEAGTVTARDVWEQVRAGRPLAFNTVMTVMQRLVGKGLLRRTGTRRSYRFAPAMSRAEFARQVARHMASGLVQDFGPGVLVEFVAALDDLSPGALDLLAAYIERRRQEGRGPEP